MQQLQVVPDGALLIHNGIIEESGATQRIENLQKARGAREIDAMGKVVMPAFVDPDAVLIAAPTQVSRTSGETKETSLRVLSRRRLEDGAIAAAAAWARYGTLTVGAHSGYAGDLRETTKVLRIHQGLQNKPLRIRSIFSPRKASEVRVLIEQWLPAIRRMNLAPVLEISVGSENCPCLEDVRRVATVAAGLGYSLRIRAATAPLGADVCELALEGGVLAMVSGMPPPVPYATAAYCVGLRTHHFRHSRKRGRGGYQKTNARGARRRRSHRFGVQLPDYGAGVFQFAIPAPRGDRELRTFRRRSDCGGDVERGLLAADVACHGVARAG